MVNFFTCILQFKTSTVDFSQSCCPGQAAPGPVTPGAPFEPSQPPVIEGFSPSICSTPESFKEKFLRKTHENPMVSIGCLGTAAALTYGLYCFHQGQSHRLQLMMRTRIAAQGFTVAAILLSLAASTMKSRS
ncbi:HIG1 domain family member 2A-like [Canis lupus dingo]|uniref:HIG1 domain family member 2A-like n=1 Tax=Canis lupus dingo TaxID=286419 RepID=UPI0020C2871A|nr:HIG1 domain family member 2A-like [Canis lupus dingo]